MAIAFWKLPAYFWIDDALARQGLLSDISGAEYLQCNWDKLFILSE
jgi:hypothetical protein